MSRPRTVVKLFQYKFIAPDLPKRITYNAIKLNASAVYFRLQTVSPFQRITRQLIRLKSRAKKMNEVSHLLESAMIPNEAYNEVILALCVGLTDMKALHLS